jgi:hypothetical protein
MPAPTEEVVEVSISIQADQVLVEEWGGPDRDDLGNLVAAGPGSYRLRMHARGRDQAETILKQTDQYGPAPRHLATSTPDPGEPARRPPLAVRRRE